MEDFVLVISEMTTNLRLNTPCKKTTTFRQVIHLVSIISVLLMDWVRRHCKGLRRVCRCMNPGQSQKNTNGESGYFSCRRCDLAEVYRPVLIVLQTNGEHTVPLFKTKKVRAFVCSILIRKVLV